MLASEGVVLRILLEKEGLVVGVLASTAEEGVDRWSPKPEWNSHGGLEKSGWQRCLTWDYLGRVPEEVGLVLHHEGSVLYKQRRASRAVSKAGGPGNGGDIGVWGMASHCRALNATPRGRQKFLAMCKDCGLWLTELFFVHHLLASSQLP